MQKYEEMLAADSEEFAKWKLDYDRSRRTVTRTNYEVDFITAFTKLTNLGAKYDPVRVTSEYMQCCSSSAVPTTCHVMALLCFSSEYGCARSHRVVIASPLAPFTLIKSEPRHVPDTPPPSFNDLNNVVQDAYMHTRTAYRYG